MEIIDQNPEGEFDFLKSLGITEERADELAINMDQMVKYFKESGGIISSFRVYQTIAAFCDNIPELIYCTISHTSWQHYKGTSVCPPMNRTGASNELRAEIMQASSFLSDIINQGNLWSNVREQAYGSLALLRQTCFQSIAESTIIPPPSKT